MRVRIFRLTVILVLGLLVAPLLADAQKPGKVYRIGWLGPEPDRSEDYLKPFLEQLRGLGWVEGQNFVMEYQSVPHRQFPKVVSDLAAELVESKVDIIVAMGSRSTLVAHAATSTIPVVMTASRPVERGLIESFARPGGNITGLTNNPGTGFTGKMLQLLKEAAPEVSRVAVLLNSRSKRLSSPDERVKNRQTIIRSPDERVKYWQTIIRELGLTAVVAIVGDNSKYADAFEMFTQEQANALFVSTSSLNLGNRKRIMEFAISQQFPTMCGSTRMVKAGCLMSYWTKWSDLRRRSAIFVDKILKGANPPELPVERPTKFDLVINLKTVKALGLTIPPTILYQADEVIR